MKPENVTCPVCSGPMVSRLNTAKQSRFWGCKAFPNCKGTRDTNGRAPHEREAERWNRHQNTTGDDDRRDRW